MNSINAFLNPIPLEPIQAPVSQRYLMRRATHPVGIPPHLPQGK